MQEFEDYVKSNWRVPTATSCGITYTHTTKIVKNVKNHNVNLTIAWRDKDNNPLQTEKLVFTNDDMTKTYDKKMFLINRKELVNKFRAAKQSIVNKIIAEKQEKLMALENDITELLKYSGRANDIIPNSMKNTIDIVRTQAQPAPPTQSFDM